MNMDCVVNTKIMLYLIALDNEMGKFFHTKKQWQKWTEGSGGTTLLLYFAFALVHDSRGIGIVNFTISLALSAGTLMASAGTPSAGPLLPLPKEYSFWSNAE